MTQPTTADLPDDIARALSGQYHVDRLLGAGGMGRVYLGRDVTLDRPVAIKVIAAELTTSAVIRDRFLQEARTVARLRHPNIVAVHAAGAVEGLLYFVMEYIPGQSLRDLLDLKHRYDDWRAVVALRDLANALAYAHERGIVHRDVKPDNILLDGEKGCAMLTDFGVARALAGGGDDRLTGTGFVLGSPRYMSPEQASGERDLDGRSDVYSLALVGYEMFAGEPAVSGTRGASILVRQLTETPVPIETRSDTIPPAVADVIARALEKDPDKRITAAEMAFALDDVVAMGPDGHGRSATTPRPGGRLTPQRRRRRMAGALGVAALALLGTVYAVRARSDAPRVDPRRSYFVAPFEVQGGDPQLAWLREGSVNMLTLHFSQWRDLDVIDYERSLDLLRDADLDGAGRIGLEDARRIARRAGVGTVVMGQASRVGDSLLVVARLYDVETGRRVDEAQRSTLRTADPRPLFDALARDLLDLVGAPPTTLALTASTTTSVEAYRAYLEGTRALNAWRLNDADSLFRRATDADTTFALAYYRHALTIGWKSASDSSQFEMMRRAAEYGSRLPQRERDLVAAYADLIGALRAGPGATPAARSTLYVAAQQKYQAIVAARADDAEAWYGLGDAYFHHVDGDPRLLVKNWTRALRAFNRTLMLDSSFHLAYSHKLDVYRQGSNAGSGIVLDGDSLVFVGTDSARQAFGPTTKADAARERARRLAIQEARAWVAADPVSHAYRALVGAYAEANLVDSATAVVADAMRRPSSRSALLPFMLASVQAQRDPQAAIGTLRAALREFDAAALRNEGGDRGFVVLTAGDAATLTGSVKELRDVARLAIAVQPTVPGRDYRSAPVVRGWNAAAELALGLPMPTVRAAIDSAIAHHEARPGDDGKQLRRSSIAIPYVSYLITHDTGYLRTLRKWWDDNPGAPLFEIDALEALLAGDTARAAELARRFPSADSLRASQARMSAMRWVARAEVAAALGDIRRAIAYYETLDPMRFSKSGGAFDPGWPLYARSFLMRGYLYEQVGDREKADQAYTKFLDLWRDVAHPALEPQLRAAREGRVRVRDAAATLPLGPKARE